MDARTFVRSLVAALALAGFAATALAQNISTDLPDTSDRGRVFARFGYGHRFKTDLDGHRFRTDGVNNGPGSFSTDDTRLEVGGIFDFRTVRWANAFAYGFGHYDSGRLDANLHSFTLASVLDIDVAKRCSLLVGPVIGLAAEENADWGDAWSYGALLGTVYRASEDLTLGISLVAMRRIEEGVGFAPIPMVSWQFADDWKFYTGLTEAAARRGVGSYVGWHVTPWWEIAAGFQFEHRRFRVSGYDTADFGTRVKNGIAEDKSVPIYARTSVEIVEGLLFDLTLGAVLGGEFEANDNDDRFLFDVDYEATPMIGMRLRYVFTPL